MVQFFALVVVAILFVTGAITGLQAGKALAVIFLAGVAFAVLLLVFGALIKPGGRPPQ